MPVDQKPTVIMVVVVLGRLCPVVTDGAMSVCLSVCLSYVRSLWLLVSVSITVTVCCSRWVRLLFGREFPMQDLLMLWDAIFGDGISFDLVDYVFVAMLLYIRNASQLTSVLLSPNLRCAVAWCGLGVVCVGGMAEVGTG